MSKRFSNADRDQAIKRLHEILKPGDTVYTNLRHVARSGMMRAISLHKIEDDTPYWLSYNAAAVGVGSWSERYEAVRMDGCGMDMGFAAVYDLARILFPDGFDCIGEGCPASDHSNDRGVRDYSPTRHHKDGGYALKQRWLS